LLETVRQYAQERLNDLGEWERTGARHLDFYLALAQKAEPELVGPEQGAWLERLDLEWTNLLAAHMWCDRAEEVAQLGLRLVYSLHIYFIYSGLVAPGLRVTLDALTRPRAQGRNLARCRALWAAADLSYFAGRYREAQEHAEMSLAIAREIRDKSEVAVSLRLLGQVLFARGDRATGLAHAQEAIALSGELSDKGRFSKALLHCAEMHRAVGNLDMAEQLYEQALAHSREVGDRGPIALSLAMLAKTSIGLGLGDRARRMLGEAFAIAEEIKWKGPIPLWQVECCTELAAFFGEWKQAARFYGAIEAQSAQAGSRREPSDEASLVPLITRTRDALGAAGFAEAEASGRSLSYDEAIAEARTWLEGSS
jgi:tetratricopeptide (TPR) repeat protein